MVHGNLYYYSFSFSVCLKFFIRINSMCEINSFWLKKKKAFIYIYTQKKICKDTA